MKNKFIETHRGIQTTTKRKNERKPITIINPWKQKSISLPRIDDSKRWAGYPGLTGISRVILPHVPKCKYFVEPFAGAAKVYQELTKLEDQRFIEAVLNDKSKFIYTWLKENFTVPLITNLDFTEIFEQYNFDDSFFLIDMPWNKSYYDQTFGCFDRPTVNLYEKEVLKLLVTFKGKFIITSRKESRHMLSSNYNKYLIQSQYVVSGHYPKVLLTTNLKLEGLEVVE